MSQGDHIDDGVKRRKTKRITIGLRTKRSVEELEAHADSEALFKELSRNIQTKGERIFSAHQVHN